MLDIDGRHFVIACAGLLAIAAPCSTAAADPVDVDFFERKIRPVLVEHCYSCHSTEAKKQKGGLNLDSRDGLRKGGDSGPALVAGRPEKSLLIKAVRYAHDDLKMPPKGKLPAAVIADLEAWVQQGAADPREKVKSGPTVASWDEAVKARRGWWSLQPVRKAEVPKVKNDTWSTQPIDRFLLARLEKAGLTPGAMAERRTLIRRLSFVLTGLPPTASDVEWFTRHAKPQASYEELVDKLLASPHFGERWARHWLDVVRYAETHGNEWNYEVHHAWRYRDYLIRAFNDDVPYDQFVREQIAGDLVPRPRWNQAEQYNESLIGTAFWRFGEVNHDDCIEFRQIGYDLLDGQLDTFGKAFQATTIACARCHDHKVDAVSMKDYYALLGVLRSSRQVSHTIDAPTVNADIKMRLQELKRDLRLALAESWQRETKDLVRYLLAAQASLDKAEGATQRAQGLEPKRLETWIAALKADKLPLGDPLHLWTSLRGASPESFSTASRQLAERYETEGRKQAEFNAKHFVTLADFRTKPPPDWQRAGQGLTDGPAESGDFAIASAGDTVLTGLYPAGSYTHLVSEKLNGTLRSPVLPKDKKYVSFHTLGGKTSAVRLVSNNCQLNYVNYKALTKNEFEWKRFPIGDADGLRTYAELLTKFDNPKFPDQLGTLGGDTLNSRVPWEEAMRDPHSFFGITRAVLHDCEETPREEHGWLKPLFDAPKDRAELAERYAQVATAAVKAWQDGTATDNDARWLDWLVRRGLLNNSPKSAPKLEALLVQYRHLEKQLAMPRIIPGLADSSSAIEQPILLRGDFRKPGELVPRRYLDVLSSAPQPFTQGSGRLELAERIASKDNPLTARVMVNRVWHHLFGTGIVRTVDDFGHVGELPSHPELLDYLATRFAEEGWSAKKLIRSIALTKAFQQEAHAKPQAGEVDPENRLLHHYPARRLEAESIRDAILAASGRLDRTLYGPSIHPFREKTNEDRRLFVGPLDGAGRRSLYIKVNLMEAPKFLGVFNLPGGKVTQGRRDMTNVPAQALALLNDPFVLQQADVWAKRLVKRGEDTVSARLEEMFQVALGRPPESDERERFEQAVARLAELHQVSASAVLASEAVWKDVAHAMYNLKEFIYIP